MMAASSSLVEEVRSFWSERENSSSSDSATGEPLFFFLLLPLAVMDDPTGVRESFSLLERRSPPSLDGDDDSELMVDDGMLEEEAGM